MRINPVTKKGITTAEVGTHVATAISNVEEAIRMVEFARSIDTKRQWQLIAVALRELPTDSYFEPMPEMPDPLRHALGDIYWFLRKGKPSVSEGGGWPQPMGHIDGDTIGLEEFIGALTLWLGNVLSLLKAAHGAFS